MKNQPLQSRLNHSPASLFVLSTRSTGVVAAVAVGLAVASRPHMAGLSNGSLLLSMGALQCLWLGANLAISFLEAPVKFLAPTPARRGLIDVGRHVFSALNKVEVAFASFDLLGWYLIMRRGIAPAVTMAGSTSLGSSLWQMVPHLAPGLIVYALQSFFFLPMMRSVGLRYIEGKPTESAKVHGVYVLLEVLKVSTLAWEPAEARSHRSAILFEGWTIVYTKLEEYFKPGPEDLGHELWLSREPCQWKYLSV
ncbi:hypothetical protein EC968_005135 [Mortierella alpina]|nr:hypothetical protein EC968_005135 [Mortierella alpina]